MYVTGLILKALFLGGSCDVDSVYVRLNKGRKISKENTKNGEGDSDEMQGNTSHWHYNWTKENRKKNGKKQCYNILDKFRKKNNCLFIGCLN